jgi:hypothetical protein
MIHLKYKCKVNFVKLPLIWIYLCLKLVFEKATAGPNTGCRSVVNRAAGTALSVAGKPKWLSWVNDPPAGSVRFTRGRVWELKNGHNSVTAQNWTHVYMNFFHHKDLGNHLLQLCPKVVKQPVYVAYGSGHKKQLPHLYIKWLLFVDSVWWGARTTQSVYLLATGRLERGLNPGGGQIFCMSRPALGSTPPPVKWVPDLFLAGKAARASRWTPTPV